MLPASHELTGSKQSYPTSRPVSALNTVLAPAAVSDSAGPERWPPGPGQGVQSNSRAELSSKVSSGQSRRRKKSSFTLSSPLQSAGRLSLVLSPAHKMHEKRRDERETSARSPRSTSSASICKRGFLTLSPPHFGLIIASGSLCGPLWRRGTGCPFGASKILGGPLIFLHYFPIWDKCAHNAPPLLS